MSRKTYKKEVMGETWYTTDYPHIVFEDSPAGRLKKRSGRPVSRKLIRYWKNMSCPVSLNWARPVVTSKILRGILPWRSAGRTMWC